MFLCKISRFTFFLRIFAPKISSLWLTKGHWNSSSLTSRRKCKSEGLDVYYLNDRSGECDFVVCKGNQVIQAIQVSYDISAENTYKREKNGLLLAARQTKCENLLLLTDHESGEIEEDGHKMKIQPVYEWSLELGV